MQLLYLGCTMIDSENNRMSSDEKSQSVQLIKESTDAAELENAVDKSPPTEQERRHMNYLIKRYLVERGYKLAAITFGEEVALIFAALVMRDWFT